MTTVTLPAKAILAAAIVAGDPTHMPPHPDGIRIADPVIYLIPDAHRGVLVVGDRRVCCYVEHAPHARLDQPCAVRIPPAALTGLYACDAHTDLLLVCANGIPGRAHLTLRAPSDAARYDTTTISTTVTAHDPRALARLLDELAHTTTHTATRISPAVLEPLLAVANDCGGARRNWSSVTRAGQHLIVRWAETPALGIACVSDDRSTTVVGLPSWASLAAPVG